MSVIRVDFETELAAAARGECLGCRAGMTHARTDACERTAPGADMSYCAECGTMWAASRMSGKYVGVGCPVCFDDAGVLRAA